MQYCWLVEANLFAINNFALLAILVEPNTCLLIIDLTFRQCVDCLNEFNNVPVLDDVPEEEESPVSQILEVTFLLLYTKIYYRIKSSLSESINYLWLKNKNERSLWAQRSSWIPRFNQPLH